MKIARYFAVISVIVVTAMVALARGAQGAEPSAPNVSLEASSADPHQQREEDSDATSPASPTVSTIQRLPQVSSEATPARTDAASSDATSNSPNVREHSPLLLSEKQLDTSIALVNYLDSEALEYPPPSDTFGTYALPPVPATSAPAHEALLKSINSDIASVAAVAAEPSWIGNSHMYLPEFDIPARNELAVRLGAWMTDADGSPVKVGEYQSLKSSLFADFDGLLTDGIRTFDVHATVLDQDASSVGIRAITPQTSASLEYERYLRRLDVERFEGYVDFDQQPPLPLPAAPENFRDMRENLTVGEDFAIRVEELDSSVQGKLTENSGWKLNVWAMRKHGERQATAMAHCFSASNATDTNGNPVTGAACHQLAQIQRIDWRTTELEPVLEARLGPVQVEYSHMLRALNTSDQFVTRPYDRFGITGNQPYGLVPENTTHLDRLKLSVQLPQRRSAYARLFSGNTENEFRDTDRRFRGFDVRLTDRSFDRLSHTIYARKYVQSGQDPGFLMPFESLAGIRSPINYDRTTAGMDWTWRPPADYGSRRNLRLTWGYQYRELQRENAIFAEQGTTFNQSDTQTHRLYFRTAMNWTRALNSSAQYRVSFIDDPLYAISTNATTNSSLPTQMHDVEFQTSWTPSPIYSLTGLVRVSNRWNSSDVSHFSEDNYDFVLTSWYAPTTCLSFVTSVAFYSNWIDQDITLGTRSMPLTGECEYGGESDVVHLSANYAWTPRVTLTAAVNYVNAKNQYYPLAPWPDLPGYSDVNVETTRFLGGFDVLFNQHASGYLRYQLFDYDDLASGFESGRLAMLLLGGSLVY